MADNIVAPASGASFATDEINDVHFPKTKVVFGGNGTATDVTPSAPLPVLDAQTVAAIQRLSTYKRAVTIMEADSDLTERPAALYISTGGTLVVRFGTTTDVTYVNIPDGSFINISPTSIRTASTVSGIVAHFYE